MRLLRLGLLTATALFLTGCAGASPGSLSEVSAALKAAIVESYDEESADVLDEKGILDQVAYDLVALCRGEDPMGMGMAFFANYEMRDVLEQAWGVACPGEAFPR